MTEFTLIRLNLTRNKLRLVLNVFAILVAFFLFGGLGSIKNAFDAGVELSAADRLVIVNKINFTQTMPVAYIEKVKRIDGVQHLTWANWFGGYYQDPRKMVQLFSVDPESYFQVYPELVIDEEAEQAWYSDRQGMIVGEALALQYGWSVGDKVPISSNIYSHKEGGQTWDLVISGIFRGKEQGIPTNYALMHHKYFFETQSYGGEWVGWMVLTTGDPALNEQVSKAIDEQFANSPAETETSTEAAFSQSFVEQMGDIGFILQSVILAAFFTILLVVGNSMSVSINERTNEIAVLKTLGFPAPMVFRMVLIEACILAVLGGLFGMLLAEFVVSALHKVPQVINMFPNLVIDMDTWLVALVWMALLGVLTGCLPAYYAFKLNTIDALSKG